MSKTVSNTISQIKSDEFFKSQSEQVEENVQDQKADLRKNEASFKSGNWYKFSDTEKNNIQDLANFLNFFDDDNKGAYNVQSFLEWIYDNKQSVTFLFKIKSKIKLLEKNYSLDKTSDVENTKKFNEIFNANKSIKQISPYELTKDEKEYINKFLTPMWIKLYSEVTVSAERLRFIAEKCDHKSAKNYVPEIYQTLKFLESLFVFILTNGTKPLYYQADKLIIEKLDLKNKNQIKEKIGVLPLIFAAEDNEPLYLSQELEMNLSSVMELDAVQILTFEQKIIQQEYQKFAEIVQQKISEQKKVVLHPNIDNVKYLCNIMIFLDFYGQLDNAVMKILSQTLIANLTKQNSNKNAVLNSEQIVSHISCAVKFINKYVSTNFPEGLKLKNSDLSLNEACQRFAEKQNADALGYLIKIIDLLVTNYPKGTLIQKCDNIVDNLKFLNNKTDMNHIFPKKQFSKKQFSKKQQGHKKQTKNCCVEKSTPPTVVENKEGKNVGSKKLESEIVKQEVTQEKQTVKGFKIPYKREKSIYRKEIENKRKIDKQNNKMIKKPFLELDSSTQPQKQKLVYKEKINKVQESLAESKIVKTWEKPWEKQENNGAETAKAVDTKEIATHTQQPKCVFHYFTWEQIFSSNRFALYDNVADQYFHLVNPVAYSMLPPKAKLNLGKESKKSTNYLKAKTWQVKNTNNEAQLNNTDQGVCLYFSWDVLAASNRFSLLDVQTDSYFSITKALLYYPLFQTSSRSLKSPDSKVSVQSVQATQASEIKI